jgi:hypothetical protein
MFKISYKFVKNESYQIFMNICKPNKAYFISILQEIGSKRLRKTDPTKTYILIKCNKNVQCTSYKYLYLQIFVTFDRRGTPGQPLNKNSIREERIEPPTPELCM